MDVIVGKLAGFCAGVKNTVSRAEELLNENNKIYCLGEIIHNGQVIKKLEEKGMVTVNDIENIPDGEKVIFRAHGESESIYVRAREKNLDIIDLTCGKVRLIHDKVKKYNQKAFIIILGKKTHPEIVGTKGYAGDNYYIVENGDDILDAYMEFEKTGLNLVYIVAQTTFSSKYFDELSKEIEKNFYEVDCVIDKTICMATEERQKEVREMSKTVNKMIIIGGKHSSNTKELANIAQENCENVYLVETVYELKGVSFLDSDKVGIMAGASTPMESIIEVENYLKKRN